MSKMARINPGHPCPQTDTQTSGASLSKQQIAWLRFHAELPTPTRWAWQTVENEPVRGPPETWRRLRAWKRFRRYGRWAYRTCFIPAEQMNGLDAYLNFPVVTAAGYAFLDGKSVDGSPQKTPGEA